MLFLLIVLRQNPAFCSIDPDLQCYQESHHGPPGTESQGHSVLAQSMYVPICLSKSGQMQTGSQLSEVPSLSSFFFFLIPWDREKLCEVVVVKQRRTEHPNATPKNLNPWLRTWAALWLLKILCLFYSPGIEITELLLFAGEDKKVMC